MSEPINIIALDGHDGAGKTTLAYEMGQLLGVISVAPFSGKTGSQLMGAAVAGKVDLTMKIGEEALRGVISECKDSVLVLDRSWITVASLVPWDVFKDSWNTWIPTVLCWSNLETTLERLALRDEEPEKMEWHRAYLERYWTIARHENVSILRTDELAISQCVKQLALQLTELNSCGSNPLSA